MLNFSVIKDEKLRRLMQDSAKFKALSEDKQSEHLNKIKDLPPDQQKKVYDFFENDSKKAGQKLSSEEKLEILNRLYGELVKLEEKFTKLLKQEPEKKSKEEESKQMNTLMGQLKEC